MLTLALLLLLPQDSFNPQSDPERSTGDSWLTKPADQNPFPPPSLARLGDEAIRFSTSPPWRGAEHNILTITPGSKGEAVASLDTVRYQCEPSDKSRCTVVLAHAPSFAFCLQGDCRYAGTANRIHALLFRPAPKHDRKAGLALPAPCFHGPNHLTELREKGMTFNLRGYCGREHPNNGIYKLIREGAGTHWPLMGEPSMQF